MKYSFDQLMTFEQVSRAGSFSAAARAMKRSQSSVNMAMSNLEDELNIRLFERTPRQITLTEEGQVFREYTRTILQQCVEMEAWATARVTGTELQISLAIEVPYQLIAAVLYEFTMTFPQVAINIREPVQGDVEAMVRSGDVDAAIGLSRPIDNDSVNFVQLGKLIMVHVVSATHPLAQCIPVSNADLHRWRYIAFGTPQHPIASTEFLGSPMVWRVESYNAMIEAATAGLGWASIPKIFIQRELLEGSLVELRQQEYPHTEWIVGVDLLWPKNHQHGNGMRWLKKRLMNHKIFEHDKSGNKTTL